MFRKICIVGVVCGLLPAAFSVAQSNSDGPPVILPHPHPSPSPKPVAKPKPVPVAGGTLMISCDLACVWTLDGKVQGRIEAGASAKTTVIAGRHAVAAAIPGSPDRIQTEIELEAGRQSILSIELSPVREARRRAEQAQRDAELARREASEAARRQEAERRQEEARQQEMRTHADEAYRQGSELNQQKRYSEALPLLQTACEGGYMAGCNDAGRLYHLAQGAPQNDDMALQLYQKACGGGYMQGCNNLAQLYESGAGVPRNENRAFQLYQRSCAGSDMTGCWHLGILYERGRGVLPDKVRALALYQRACSGGVSGACDFANRLE